MTDPMELMAAEHDRVRRSPEHVIDAVCDVFASTETCSDSATPYVRLYLLPSSHTIKGWIAIDLHDDDAARIIAELGKALNDVLFSRAVGDGTVHEL